MFLCCTCMTIRHTVFTKNMLTLYTTQLQSIQMSKCASSVGGDVGGEEWRASGNQMRQHEMKLDDEYEKMQYCQ